MKTVGILLAAGSSERFGTSNKLLAKIAGKSIASICAKNLHEAKLHAYIGVTQTEDVATKLGGFEIVHTTHPVPSMAHSIRIGVKQALSYEPDRILICLADMPFVQSSTIKQVLEKCSDEMPSAISSAERTMPPACFPEVMFPQLLKLKGDDGARKLLSNLGPQSLVSVDAQIGADIDTQLDFAKYG